jgi:hypothetical protein
LYQFEGLKTIILYDFINLILGVRVEISFVSKQS